MALYSVYDIAEYVIKRCNEQGKSISNLKLQKILYFIQAKFLTRVGKPAFENEIEAWDLGPVVPAVYVEYRAYGSASIPYLGYLLGNKNEFPFTEDSEKVLNDIIDKCAPFSAIQLVEMTHQQDPWKNVYKRHSHNIISKESIRKFFED